MIIVINVLAASILVLILSSVMLAAKLLGRPFAEGPTDRQTAALRAHRRAMAAERRQRRQAEHQAPWRAIQDV